LFARIEHPGSGAYLTPGSPLDFSSAPRVAPATAPRLGADTDEILVEILGLPAAEIGRLHDEGVVAGPT
jgi:2-methylfumaryl-CoA isomerase